MANTPKFVNSDDRIVEIPQGLLKDMEFESVIISPVFPEVGVVVLAGDDPETNSRLVRIYSIMLKQDDETTYQVAQELQAFSFAEKPFAKEFIKRLPQMSAIELMFAMDGGNIPQFH